MQIAVIHNANPLRAAETASALAYTGMEVVDFTSDKPFETLFNLSGFVVLSDFNGNQGNELAAALKHESLRGKPIIGMGDGAIFLTRIGLIPGIWDNRAAITLQQDKAIQDQNFSNIRLSKDYQYNAFTRYLTPQHILNIQLDLPATRFHIPPGLHLEIEMQGLNVFMYCDEKGNISQKADIAAISNKAGNVMAMLPSLLILPESNTIFNSMHDHIASKYIEQVEPLNYWPR